MKGAILYLYGHQSPYARPDMYMYIVFNTYHQLFSITVSVTS